MCRKPFTRLDAKPIGQPVDRAGESADCWMRSAIETLVLRSQPCPEWRFSGRMPARAVIVRRQTASCKVGVWSDAW